MPSGVQADVKTYQMFINGEWVASKSAKTFPVYDPSTEEVIAQVPDANADDVNRAVAAAEAIGDALDRKDTSKAALAGYRPIERAALCRTYRITLICVPLPPESRAVARAPTSSGPLLSSVVPVRG